MNDAEALACATVAAEAWGVLVGTPRLIQNRENAVFEVHLRDGRHAALRLHRPGYQTRKAIRDELRITEALADAGFACPWPHRTLSNDFVHASGAEAPLASLVQWIDGAPIGAMDRTFDGSPAGHITLYRRLGELIADLHLTADAVAPQDIARPVWTRAAFCGDPPLWGRFWKNPALASDEAALLLEARDVAARHIETFAVEDIGLIHADLLQENILQSGNQLYLIDFDDCGTGFRQYDLATALIQHAERPNFVDLQDALVDGYRAGEGPLKTLSSESIAVFIVLRAIASTGWIISRAHKDDPRQGLYAARAVRLAGTYLNNRSAGL